MAGAGLVLQVSNLSRHTFRLDGDMLCSGSWRTDPNMAILPGTKTQIEFAAAQFGGVKGLAWWVDDEKRDTYLSLAFSIPRLHSGISPAAFSCIAGIPPANLKAELANADALLPYMEVAPEAAGCSWIATQVGSQTAVEVCIYEELPRYAQLEPAGFSTLPAAPASTLPLWSQLPPSAPSAPSPPSAPEAGLLGSPGGRQTRDEGEAAVGLRRFRAHTRPKDLQDGLARGLKTAGLGLAASIVAPVTGSVKGAKEGGALGFAKGLGLGLLGGCALAAGGTVAGAVQIGRGIKHTPRALISRREEKVYDQELGRWVDVDLPALEAEAAAEADSDSGSDGGRRSGGCAAVTVAETELYDLLGVRTDAAPSEIKRAYYREARRCHPDKNPGDRSATQRFQELARAYQVLSDPVQRQRYDAHGANGIATEDAVTRMDPALFFALLFGSERFLDYTGELHLAMEIDHVAKNLKHAREDFCTEEEPEPQSVRRRQFRREVCCASFLRDKLERFVLQRDIAGFVEELRAEAADLANVRFGPELLTELGEIYRIRADMYLANELSGRLSMTKRAAAARRSAHVTKGCLSLTRGACGSLISAKRISDAMKREEQRRQDEEIASGSAPSARLGGVEEAVDRALPTFLQTAWAAVVRDLDSTIKNVGRKLLQDKSVPWQIRVRRAQALRLLGEVFAEEGARSEAMHGSRGISSLSSEAARETLMEAVVGTASRA